jgi:predicted ATPase
MLSELVLGQFKAFSAERISLRPLTILVGENNSGKSSLIAAIRLLAQTIQNSDNTIPLLFDGPFGDFGTFKDVVHGNHRARPMQLGLSTPLSRRIASRDRSQDSTTIAHNASFLAEFKYRTQRKETIVRSSRLSLDDKSLFVVSRSADGDNPTIASIKSQTVPSAVRAQLNKTFRMTHFLPQPWPGGSDRSLRASRSEQVQKAAHRLGSVERDARRSAEQLVKALRNVEVVGAMREPPNRTFLHSGAVGRHIGVAGENLGGLMALALSGRKRDSFMKDVTRWMQRAGIASSVDAVWLSDRHFELVVEHPVTGERENISDVGRGTSQVLPVIVGGYRLTRGDTYLVEEPEIHLHPRAQAALGDYFLDLTRRGIQSVVETHSEYLIIRLQQHVASGALAPDDIVFHYVGSSPDGKTLIPLQLNANAVFQESIPGGFFPQRLTEANKLVSARSADS